jgi:hypothetical protein
VPDPGDVRGDLDPIRQSHAGDLAQGRIGLLGGGGVYADAHASLLRATLKGGGAGFLSLGIPPFSNQLIDRGHSLTLRFVQIRYGKGAMHSSAGLENLFFLYKEKSFVNVFVKSSAYSSS